MITISITNLILVGIINVIFIYLLMMIQKFYLIRQSELEGKEKRYDWFKNKTDDINTQLEDIREGMSLINGEKPDSMNSKEWLKLKSTTIDHVLKEVDKKMDLMAHDIPSKQWLLDFRTMVVAIGNSLQPIGSNTESMADMIKTIFADVKDIGVNTRDIEDAFKKHQLDLTYIIKLRAKVEEIGDLHTKYHQYLWGILREHNIEFDNLLKFFGKNNEPESINEILDFKAEKINTKNWRVKSGGKVVGEKITTRRDAEKLADHMNNSLTTTYRPPYSVFQSFNKNCWCVHDEKGRVVVYSIKTKQAAQHIADEMNKDADTNTSVEAAKKLEKGGSQIDYDRVPPFKAVNTPKGWQVEDSKGKVVTYNLKDEEAAINCAIELNKKPNARDRVNGDA